MCKKVNSQKMMKLRSVINFINVLRAKKLQSQTLSRQKLLVKTFVHKSLELNVDEIETSWIFIKGLLPK